MDFLLDHIYQNCPIDCPGCDKKFINPSESKTAKEIWVQKILSPWVDQIEGIKTISESKISGYRHKTVLSLDCQENKWIAGLIKNDSIINIDSCPIHSDTINQSLKIILKSLPHPEIFPARYYIQNGSFLTLIAKSNQKSDLSWINEDLKDQLEQAGTKTLFIHFNASTGKRLYAGGRWDKILGNSYHQDSNNMTYGHLSFQQLIPELYLESLNVAEDFLAPKPNDIVIDLYSGIGYSLKRWLNRGSKVVGVEISENAIVCSEINAPKAKIYRGSCEHRLPQLDQEINNAKFHTRLLYTNPPRTGMGITINNWITSKYKPNRIVYMSCSAGTLKKDLDFLTESLYEVKKIIPFDFFPRTKHVEILTLLSKKD